MRDEKARLRIEKELEYDEELIWAGKPHTFVYSYSDFFTTLAIFAGVYIARSRGVDINSWGPWTVVAGLIFLHGFYPNFEVYGVTNKRVIIKRTWPLMLSAFIERSDINSISIPKWGFGDVINISKKSSSNSFWPALEGSSVFVSFGFWEWHWYNLFTSVDTKRALRALS